MSGVTCAAVEALVGSLPLGGGGLIASIALGPIQFDQPSWLWLLLPAAALTLWIGRKSLSGQGTTSRRVSLVIRLVLLALIIGSMADPNWRKQSRDVSVTAVLDSSRSIPLDWQTRADQYLEEARSLHNQKEDRLGVVTVAQDAMIQQLPSKLTRKVERQSLTNSEGTDLASGLKLAMAMQPKDAANRLLLISDANETSGNVLAAAAAAASAGIPIDVLPVTYTYPSEVVADQVIAPATARMGEVVNVRVNLIATRAAKGKLTLMLNDEVVDLNGEEPGQSSSVSLQAGSNWLMMPVTLRDAGAQQFKAVFEAEGSQAGAGDTILENNQAMSVTFVSGRGRVLIVSDDTVSSAPLIDALTESKIESRVIGSGQWPSSLTELTGYDGVVLVNQPASNFSAAAQEDMKRYVHDAAGGLVMIGGPDSFGAGGWLGSPVEDILPIRLDPPQKRQMPRGALVMVMHSIEMPQGVFYGQETARKAVEAMSRLDLVGINEYRPMDGGTKWVYPLREVGDGVAVKRAIKSLQFGDMPDMGPSVQMAYDSLIGAPAGTKHMIIISDGDPSPPSQRLLQLCRKAKITISTVGVYPHSAGDLTNMQMIAKETGGRYYEVTTDTGLAKITQIFIKEAQTVKRSLIWEGDPFSPAVTGIATGTMRGLGSVPPIRGYVVAADREGLSQVTLRGKENDPIAAQWQFGMGRVITFTSDAASLWSPDWVAWTGYRPFWEQHVRWAMRPSGSANARTTVERQGEQSRVIVDLTDQTGERVNFARVTGRLLRPDGKSEEVALREAGLGRYEVIVPTSEAGSYLMSLKYAAPGADGKMLEGNVQASINRAYADEFRSLTDNEPLLRQVAQLTGGRVLTGDPKVDDLWAKDGLKMPVAFTWAGLPILIAGIGLFLMDVGVRRVRVDLVAIWRRAKRAMGRGAAQSAVAVDSLRTAREKARKDRAATGSGAVASGDGERTAPVVDVASKAKKFEAAEGAGRGGVQIAGESPAPVVDKSKKAGSQDESKPEEGLSRLMKAKKRAQDEMKDE